MDMTSRQLSDSRPDKPDTHSPYKQTNPRYRSFCQAVYTAGDEEQWQENIKNIDMNSDLTKIKAIRLKAELNPRSQIGWYGKLNSVSRMNTFRYLFHELKKGIFVQIEDGEMVTFLPFSKHNYYQNWGKNIRGDSASVMDVIKKGQIQAKRPFNIRRIKQEQGQWIGNGFLLRYENPTREGDSNVTVLRDMLEVLCTEREIPNMEFFVNRHDFPRLRKDLRHPFASYLGPDTPVKHYGTSRYCPIFSMCTTDEFADIPIPTWDDWLRVTGRSDFASSYRNRTTKNYEFSPTSSWMEKKDKAVFRGASTGQGICPESNPRLKLAAMAAQDSRLDVGITTFNYRPRVVRTDGARAFVDLPSTELPIKIVPTLTVDEQSQYRYVINVDGHSCAFRLVSELGFGSVILLVKSSHNLWISKALKDGVHYVGVKADLSDLLEKLDWCQANPQTCEAIASNARKFYLKYCQKDGILDYLQSVFVKTRQRLGQYSYNVLSWRDITASLEKKYMGSFSTPEFTTLTPLKVSRSTEVSENERGEIVKAGKDAKRSSEILHDAFVAVVLAEHTSAQLAKCLALGPNLSVWEKVSGPTLAELVKTGIGKEMLIDITLQVCGILQQLQSSCFFIHNDLYPWNIICSNPRERNTYITSRGEWSSIGKVHITLVDFGKSSVSHQNTFYGRFRPFEPSTIRDVVTFIVSSANVLLSQHLGASELSYVFSLMNFLAEKEPAYTGGVFKGVKRMRSFTCKAKKYTEMMYSDKGHLEECEPADLLKYLDLADVTPRRPSPRMEQLDESSLDDLSTVLKLLKTPQKYTAETNNTLRIFARLTAKMNLLTRDDEISKRILQKIEES